MNLEDTAAAVAAEVEEAKEAEEAEETLPVSDWAATDLLVSSVL